MTAKIQNENDLKKISTSFSTVFWPPPSQNKDNNKQKKNKFPVEVIHLGTNKIEQERTLIKIQQWVWHKTIYPTTFIKCTQ